MANNVSTPRKGGQELPGQVQDRPEQNRGYDDAVRGERAIEQQDPKGVGDEEFEEEKEEEEEEDDDHVDVV